MCGEKFAKKSLRCCGSGSPPACAGKSVSVTLFDYNCQDHPRVCGEKYTGTIRQQLGWGSPPRVRGKAEKTALDGKLDGITPACAGKRLNGAADWSQYRDHPRVCGEKPRAQSGTSSMLGSPPRVRGKVIFVLQIIDPVRITPACAGKSNASSRCATTSEDHPRVCGEKRFSSSVRGRSMGSPPRVRGKVRYQAFFARLRRITPACAGKRTDSTISPSHG